MKFNCLHSFALICIFSIQLQAQYNEVGVHFGTSNYFGDLSENKMRQEGFKPLIGIFAKRNFTKYLSVKAAFSKAEIIGNDAWAKLPQTKERNLNFRSEILELAVTGEVNLSAYNIRAKQTGVPYFFMGIALSHFNPQAQMRGNWYDLQPLRTEGKKYNRNTVAIPFGFGLKFNISYKVNFGFEIGARKTFTDYLDDVSNQYIDVLETRQTAPMTAALAYRTPELTGVFAENPAGQYRGNPANNDWYIFGAATVSINLTDKYGIDFDHKYDIFKEHLVKPEKVNPPKEKKEKVKKTKAVKEKKIKAEKNRFWEIFKSTKKDKKDPRYKQHKKGIFQKKDQLKPSVKKRTH